MLHAIRSLVHSVNAAASMPLASFLAVLLVVIWLGAGVGLGFPQSWFNGMEALSAVVTLVMVFVIASAQRRDTRALHLKIDMLVAAHPELSNAAVGLEGKLDHHFDEVHSELRELISAESPDGSVA